MPVDPVRDAAIDILLRVFERGVHLDESLDKTLRRKPMGDRSRRFLTQLVYGTTRYKLLCDHVLRPLCRQPLEDLPAPVFTVLRMAVYQGLFLSQVTRPAMVHTSVDLARHRGHAGLARLANAVLRKVPESLDEVRWPAREKSLARFLSVRHSLSQWLVEMWMAEHGDEQAEALCAACNEPAYASLRTNLLRTTREELRDALGKSGIASTAATPIPEELSLGDYSPVTKTKWYQQGLFVIQDPASMLPAHLLEPRPGDRVLDLCAAPGGKTTHLAALAQDQAEVVALELNPRRMKTVVENVERLGLQQVRLVCGDGLRPPFRGEFDRILVDAPCSGLGTIRRHPDLKWNVQPESLGRLADQQLQLLLSAGRLCKNGGLIVYSVCTFTAQETRELVERVLHEGGLALEDGPELLNPWKIAPGQYLTLPSAGALDGFFLTRFRKQS